MLDQPPGNQRHDKKNGNHDGYDHPPFRPLWRNVCAQNRFHCNSNLRLNRRGFQFAKNFVERTPLLWISLQAAPHSLAHRLWNRLRHND
jgi:hypothetical protein